MVVTSLVFFTSKVVTYDIQHLKSSLIEGRVTTNHFFRCCWKVHDKINALNRLFSFLVLMALTTSALNSIISICILAKAKFDSPASLTPLPIIILHLSRIILLCLSGEMITRNINDLFESASRIMTTKEGTRYGSGVADMLKLAQIRSMSFKLSAFQLFNVDSSILISITAAIITHSVILIQTS